MLNRQKKLAGPSVLSSSAASSSPRLLCRSGLQATLGPPPCLPGHAFVGGVRIVAAPPMGRLGIWPACAPFHPPVTLGVHESTGIWGELWAACCTCTLPSRRVQPGHYAPEGLQGTEWTQTPNGRRARIYSLTRAGRKQLEVETADWARRASAIARLPKAEA